MPVNRLHCEKVQIDGNPAQGQVRPEPAHPVTGSDPHEPRHQASKNQRPIGSQSDRERYGACDLDQSLEHHELEVSPQLHVPLEADCADVLEPADDDGDCRDPEDVNHPRVVVVIRDERRQGDEEQRGHHTLREAKCPCGAELLAACVLMLNQGSTHAEVEQDVEEPDGHHRHGDQAKVSRNQQASEDHRAEEAQQPIRPAHRYRKKSPANRRCGSNRLKAFVHCAQSYLRAVRKKRVRLTRNCARRMHTQPVRG